MSPRISDALTTISRRVILILAQSPIIARLVQRYGRLLGLKRFVPGETLDECVVVLQDLNSKGLKANTTLLGEGINSPAEAEAIVTEYEVILDRLAQEGARCNVALKLSHLGVTFDEDLAYNHLFRLLGRAAGHGNSIRIDMEDSPLVDPTLRIYRRLREAGHDNVGLALQAYLYRTADDLESLLPLQPNVRIVKGAYLESPDVAFPEKEDVDANYIRLAERSLQGGGYTALATHDERIIDHLIAFTGDHNIGTDRFEFQMLYGIRPNLQVDLAGRGYPVLVATPFGPQWYPYLMRRLAERPANVLFFLRSLVQR